MIIKFLKNEDDLENFEIDKLIRRIWPPLKSYDFRIRQFFIGRIVI